MPFVVEVTYPAYVFIAKKPYFVKYKYTEAGGFPYSYTKHLLNVYFQPQLTLL